VNLPLAVNTSHRIRELDGWRAISVLLVVFSHYFSYRCADLVHSLPAGLARIVVMSGSLGPQIFFVISGFVICRLMIMEEEKYGSISLKGFYYRRAFRILPPLFTYLAAVFLLWKLGLIHESRKALAYAAFFLYDVRWGPNSWFVGHTWSLSVEEQFYLIFPTAWLLTPARLRSPVAACTFVLCGALTLVPSAPIFRLLKEEFPLYFAQIAFGVWMALNERRVRAMAARVPGIVIGIICLMLLILPNYAPVTLKVVLFYGVFVPIGIGLVLMYSLERGKWLRAVLCSKPMQAIGLTSYGIYLWQQIFTAAPERYTARGVVLGYLLPALLVIIPVSYFFLEKPAMRIGRALSQGARDTKQNRKRAENVQTI
jgi:peptidoglycan/LPS O-acetylase OafA/YrhL